MTDTGSPPLLLGVIGVCWPLRQRLCTKQELGLVASPVAVTGWRSPSPGGSSRVAAAQHSLWPLRVHVERPVMLGSTWPGYTHLSQSQPLSTCPSVHWSALAPMLTTHSVFCAPWDPRKGMNLPILQMGKLSHKEVKSRGRVTWPIRGRGRIGNWGSGPVSLPGPCAHLWVVIYACRVHAGVCSTLS